MKRACTRPHRQHGLLLRPGRRHDPLRPRHPERHHRPAPSGRPATTGSSPPTASSTSVPGPATAISRSSANVARCSAGNFAFDRKAGAEQLVTQALPGSTALIETSEADWATYRADNARSAGSSVKLAPSSGQRKWHYRSETESRPLRSYRGGWTDLYRRGRWQGALSRRRQPAS